MAPESLLRMQTHNFSVLNQTQQVFVYEESIEQVNAEKNGTLKLLRILPEGSLVTAKELHTLRKEFLMRVFTFYILRYQAGQEEDNSQRMTSEKEGESFPVQQNPDNES